MTGRIVSSSAVSPELEMREHDVGAVIMPRSPWLASAGCRKNAGVPVLASVAAILAPIWPDLPMPVTDDAAGAACSSRQACANAPSRRLCSATTPATSMRARADRGRAVRVQIGFAGLNSWACARLAFRGSRRMG